MSRAAFGSRLRDAILNEHLTVTEFAQQVDLCSTQLFHYLSGKNSPSVDILSRMLLALPNADARTLITGKAQ
jgi:transcriptional regulator with XRE-family HTH domain